MELQAPPLNVDVALQRLNRDRKLLVRMADFYLEDAPQLFADLRTAWHSGALPDVARNAHSLRGLASSFEAVPVMQLAAEIENISRRGGDDPLSELVEKLDIEVIRLAEALQQLKEESPR